MKIAIIGNGKMGQAIRRIASQRGHSIVSVIDIDNLDDIDSPAFASADVAIEFTRPDAALDNYRRVFPTRVPLVSGTTGWGNPESLRDEIKANDATFLWSSNFSLGVNIFFALNSYLARIMNRFPQYTPTIEEVHHIHKLDHPSGTAKTLAEGVIDATDRISAWTENTDHPDSELLITHRREGEVPGIHSVKWDSPLDSITIVHSAKSRDSFALGAVIAAEWAAGKKGLLSMDSLMADILKSDK